MVTQLHAIFSHIIYALYNTLATVKSVENIFLSLVHIHMYIYVYYIVFVDYYYHKLLLVNLITRFQKVNSIFEINTIMVKRLIIIIE